MGLFLGNTPAATGTSLIVDPADGSGINMRVTERFTRINDTQIEYAYTINDESFTAPWSARIPIRKVADTLFEYACHEVNRSMESMLRGARLAEAE